MTRLAKAPTDAFRNLGDLLAELGDIPPGRIRLHPPPGTATEADVLAVLDRENVPCELVAGTLVEKAIGYPEARLAGFLLTFLNLYLMRENRGAAAGWPFRFEEWLKGLEFKL